jgi:alanyl-tRNA synthetase
MQTLYDLRDEYLEEKKESEKILAKQNINMALEKIDSIVTNATVVDGMKIVVSEFDVDTMDELKSIADVLRNKIGSGAGLIYFSADNKINLCAVVSDNLIKDKKLNAGKIVGEVAKLIGGGGGGKPHLATAGGKDVSKLNDAISEFSEIIKRHLSI